ncbi:MAG: hypothetical protein HY774_15740 [Acidobacteria bacterium]|jgi:hypothetical protein|nr:hypothetical protein [Acidobacteriota bacterium]
MICHSCGRDVRILGRVGRTAECTECGADLHCCRNCRFFDTSAPNQCREPIAEPEKDKAAANFCDYFEANTKIALTTRSGPTSSDSRKAFDALFKKK